jgi:DNA-binding LacI/PurR family transcriptional regulator
MKVTIKEVAEKAGVSTSTVSRVVGNYGYVSKKARRRILAAIRELGYKPNATARSMVTKSTRTIGLVITDIINPFFAQLARAIEEVTWQNGYTLILANTDENLEHERAVVNTLQEKRVDGLILVPASSNPAPHLKDLIQDGTSLVLLDRNVRDCAVDVVMVDNENGAYQAVKHLIENGYRRIAMIADNLEITTNAERIAGYYRALKEAGIEADEDLVRSCRYTQQSAQTLVTEMLKSPQPPTALFTANNFMTMGAVHAIQEAGLSIPVDIGLVGFDDVNWTEPYSTSLTVVTQPVYDMGKVAGQRLLARMKGDASSPQEIRLKTRFIIRQSGGIGRPKEEAVIHPG